MSNDDRTSHAATAEALLGVSESGAGKDTSTAADYWGIRPSNHEDHLGAGKAIDWLKNLGTGKHVTDRNDGLDEADANYPSQAHHEVEGHEDQSTATTETGRKLYAEPAKRIEPYEVAIGIHVFKRLRNLVTLGIIASRPQGITNTELQEEVVTRLRQVGDETTPRMSDIVARWLCKYGLVDTMVTNHEKGFMEHRVTEQGLDLLPLAGNLVGWFASMPEKTDPADPTAFLGTYDSELAPEHTETAVTGALAQLDLLSMHIDGPSLSPVQLSNVPGASGPRTYSQIARWRSEDIVVVVPTGPTPNGKYPVLQRTDRSIADFEGDEFELSFANNLLRGVREGESLTAHPILHLNSTPLRNICKPSSGERSVDAYRRRGSQTVARLLSQGIVRIERPDGFQPRHIVLNPFYSSSIRKLLDLVEQAETSPDGYTDNGLIKLHILLKDRTRSGNMLRV